MKKYKKLLIKVIVSVSILAYIIYKESQNKANILDSLSQFDLRYFPLILLCIALSHFFSSVRWKKLLLNKDQGTISVLELTKLYFIGAFFNNFMPTSIGGDVYKIYRLSKKLHDPFVGFASTFMERFTGVLVLMFISIIAMFWTNDLISELEVIKRYNLNGYVISLGILISFFLGIVCGLLFLKILSKKSEKVRKVYNALIVYKREKGVLVYAFGTSFLVQFMSIMAQYFVFVGLGIKINILYAFLFTPIITVATVLIPSIAGFGVQDGFYQSLFGLVGVSASMAFGASIIYHLSKISISLLGGLFYALEKDTKQ